MAFQNLSYKKGVSGKTKRGGDILVSRHSIYKLIITFGTLDILKYFLYKIDLIGLGAI